MNEQNKPDWEQREENDDYLQATDDLVTEIDIFPSTKKPYLTLVGLAKFGNKHGIDVSDLKIEKTDDEYIATCKGVMEINGKPVTRYAGHSEFRNGKDKHIYAKLISKLQRNLFKIFAYGHDDVKQAFADFKESGGKQPPVQQPPAQQQEKTSPLEEAKENVRQATRSEPTIQLLESIGKKTSDVHKAAVAVYGEESQWNIQQWKDYRTDVVNMRKKTGRLWDKLKPVEKSETKPSNDPDDKVGF